MAAGVEQLQLVGDHRRGQLPARVTDGQGQLKSRPLPLVQREEAAAQQPAAAVERVVPVPAPAEGLLLPTPADVVDNGLTDPHDVESVQHPHRPRQADAQRGGVAAERVARGDRNALPPGGVLRADPLLHNRIRPVVVAAPDC